MGAARSDRCIVLRYWMGAHTHALAHAHARTVEQPAVEAEEAVRPWVHQRGPVIMYRIHTTHTTDG